jgi:teichuronic acid biosynthesis glycosyltransferase TuaG
MSCGDLVSIIMPAFCASKTISSSIESVKSQIYEEWELIIIDDASIDNTKSIAECYAKLDSRIKVISNSQNYGVADSRNIGISSSKGKYIAFLDADDIWQPKKLTCQIKFMKEKNSCFSYTSYRKFYFDPVDLGSEIKPKKYYTYEKLLGNTGIACSTVILNREIIKEIRFPLIRHEDFGLWLDILSRGHIASGLCEPLTGYRVSKNSISGNKFKSILWVWKIYREKENLNLFKSFKYLVLYGFNAITKHYILK